MMQSILNETKSINSGTTTGKIDCAKQCPCGVPVIPVPDQWLEVMVTGGFKVWHIIFIIIAFIVTMVVVYCCFHRCRIPRTKQEIEADLMRSNLSSKFCDYLQELPNEPTTFVEALKKVQEIEEKLEQDDALFSREIGARKRIGWLKLKSKGENKETNEAKKTNLDNNCEPATEEKLATTVPIIQPNVANEPIKSEATLKTLEKDDAEKVTKEHETKTGSRQQPKRRKHKPNLSRTKVAREKSRGDTLEIDKPPEQISEQANHHHRQPYNHRPKKEPKTMDPNNV